MKRHLYGDAFCRFGVLAGAQLNLISEIFWLRDVSTTSTRWRFHLTTSLKYGISIRWTFAESVYLSIFREIVYVTQELWVLLELSFKLPPHGVPFQIFSFLLTLYLGCSQLRKHVYASCCLVKFYFRTFLWKMTHRNGGRWLRAAPLIFKHRWFKMRGGVGYLL